MIYQNTGGINFPELFYLKQSNVSFTYKPGNKQGQCDIGITSYNQAWRHQ